MGNSASIGDVVLGIRLDDAALNAGLAAARARIEGTAPANLTAPRIQAPPPPPPIQLPRFDTAELERIRVAQGLAAQSTRSLGVASLQAQSNIRGLQTSLQGAAQGAAEVVASQAGIPPALAGLAVGATGAVALGAGLAVAGGFAVSAANEMETLKKQLTLVTGSTAAADAAFKQLQQYAQISPFETTEVVNAGKQLAAFGFTTAQAVEFTERLGDVAVATGSDMGGLILNLGQIQSRGFANLVDINQFLQRGIPLWDLLTQATGKTRAELQALEGGIPADAILEAFRILTDAGGAFFQASETGVTALDRDWASLVDTIKLAAIPLGELLAPAVVQTIAGAAQGIAEWGRAFENLKGKAEEVAANPIVRTLLGLGGKALGAIQSQLPFGQIQNAVSRLAGQAPPAASAEIPTTAADEAKLRAQEENRKQQLARRAAEEEKQRQKEEANAQKQLQDAQKRQIEYNKAQADLQKLSEIQSKLSPGGQGLGIAGINPQTVAQVQQIATTLDLSGNRVAQSLVQGATQAGQELIKASDQLRNAEKAAFDLLKDSAQQDLLRNAAQNVKDNVANTRLDPLKIEEVLGVSLQDSAAQIAEAVNPEALFKVAEQVTANSDANLAVKAATEANTAALGALAAELANVPRVNVTVPAGSAVDSNANTEVRYN